MDKEIPRNDVEVLERVIQELKSSKHGDGEKCHSQVTRGLWVVYCLHVMEARAFGISHEEQGEHGALPRAQRRKGYRRRSNYFLRGLQRKQYPETRAPLRVRRKEHLWKRVRMQNTVE